MYDAQLAEFILGGQSEPYPALAEVVVRYDLPAKLDVVRTEYWERGIDTDAVPWEILGEYCLHDIDITLQLFHAQKGLFKGNMKKLFLLQCEDLKGLQEAEQNGLRYDLQKAKELGAELQVEIARIDAELRGHAGIDWLNFSSSDQLSCLLYGGVIYERVRERTERILKSGEVKVGERWGLAAHSFPRLVSPLKGTESGETSKLADGELNRVNNERETTGKKSLVRVYSTAAPVLQRLRAKGRGKSIIGLLLKRAIAEKLDSTYYTGLINKAAELEWEGDEVHGQFNLVVAGTGRLSSSNPNLQNFSGEIKELFYSRYV